MALASFLVLGLAGACANDRGPYPNLPPLGARLEFLSKNLCGQGVSPEIRLGGIPAGTASYKLLLTNVSVLNAPRWEKTIKAEAALIPEGSIADFDSPCPGERQIFNYRLEIMALAASGQSLAYGWTFAQARSLTLQIEQEQTDMKRPLIDRPNRSMLPAPRNPPFFIQ